MKGQSLDTKLESLTTLVNGLKAKVEKQAATIANLQKQIGKLEAEVPGHTLRS